MSDLKKLGARGEAHAWQLLQKRGDTLVAKNFSCPLGELDLVTWHNKTLVFTEVRARSNVTFGSPAETVTRSKQEKIKRAANWFSARMFKGRPLPACRFDIIWILARENTIVDAAIIEGAFC
ncbi:MAG: YraN family protein [Planctomycetota bacterium]